MSFKYFIEDLERKYPLSICTISKHAKREEKGKHAKRKNCKCSLFLEKHLNLQALVISICNNYFHNVIMPYLFLSNCG